jgi:hypothetical protein
MISKFNWGCSLIVVLGVLGCSSNPQPPRTVAIVEPQMPRRTEAPQNYSFNQTAETNTTLFSADRSRKIISDFSSLYAGNGKPSPAFAIRVNPTADGNRTVPSQFRDQQATADLMRDFGAPLRESGIQLVDEASNPAVRPDIVVSVLISWKNIQMTGFSGEAITKSVPDMQATAIRLADNAILGYAGTANLIGERQNAWVAVERVGIPDVMRSTALALMDDMVARRVQ